jgi:hypothetical protein
MTSNANGRPGMARLLAQERETIIRYDGTVDPAVVGSNIPTDVARLTKLWGPAPDIRGDWHSWPNIPKGAAKLPRPRKQRVATEAQKAAGRKLGESRRQPK